MNKNCLVTTLKDSIDNNAVEFFGELIFDIDATAVRTTQFQQLSLQGTDIRTFLTDGLKYKDNSTETYNEGLSWTVKEFGQTAGKLHIVSKYALEVLNISNILPSSSYSYVATGMKNLNYMGVLKSMVNYMRLKVDDFKTLTAITNLSCNLLDGENLVSLPDSLEYLRLDQHTGELIWDGERDDELPIITITPINNAHINLGDYVDAMLINQAKCQATEQTVKEINVYGNRTSASDAAVSTLKGKGYDVVINGISL